MTCPGGSPDPTCSMSRIIRSMPVRSELLTPGHQHGASLVCVPPDSVAVAVAPITTVMMPIETSISPRLNPAWPFARPNEPIENFHYEYDDT